MYIFLSGFPYDDGNRQTSLHWGIHLKLVFYLDALPARMMLKIATAVPSLNSQYRMIIVASHEHQIGVSHHKTHHEKAQPLGSSPP